MKHSVERLWPGETVVCIGTGPSLTQADVDVCRGKARVIAVNDAYRMTPWADAIYACDDRWVTWHKGVPEFQGLKYSMTVTKKWAEWRRMRNDGLEGLCLSPDGLRTGRNSGYQAINLAVHLGAKRIVLLGYDMSRDKNGRSHFFGEHPRRATPSPYHSFVKCFDSLVKPLAKLGVEVVNCSRRTDLKVFPRMELAEALPMRELAEAS